MIKNLFLAILIFVSANVFGQAKKPRIMVVPSDVWCNTNNYMEEYENQGRKVKTPNYIKALQENAELNQVITTIGSLMIERGFELELLKDAVLGDQQDEAALDLLQSKDGGSVATNQFDKVYSARCDIIMELDWQLVKSGFMNQVNYTLTGKDSYTRKQIAGGELRIGSQLTTNNISILLKEAVLSDIDNFNAQLQGYFDKLFQIGREVSIDIKRFDSWDGDLESEYDGKELREIIEDWMSLNTKEGRFTTAKSSADQIVFKEVRIPLFDDRQRAIDTKMFLTGLQKYLKAAPYNITSKVITKGLGQAALVVGAK